MKIRQREKNWKKHWFFLVLRGKDYDNFTRSDIEHANCAVRRAKRSFL